MQVLLLLLLVILQEEVARVEEVARMIVLIDGGAGTKAAVAVMDVDQGGVDGVVVGTHHGDQSNVEEVEVHVGVVRHACTVTATILIDSQGITEEESLAGACLDCIVSLGDSNCSALSILGRSRSVCGKEEEQQQQQQHQVQACYPQEQDSKSEYPGARVATIGTSRKHERY